MTYDPIEFLKAAAAECAEVDEWRRENQYAGLDLYAILALARLVAKYKWAAESLQTELLQAALDHGFSIPTLAVRLAKYEADRA